MTRSGRKRREMVGADEGRVKVKEENPEYVRAQERKKRREERRERTLVSEEERKRMTKEVEDAKQELQDKLELVENLTN